MVIALPAGAKIRRTLQWVVFSDVPAKVLERDPRRLFAEFTLDNNSSNYPCFSSNARSFPANSEPITILTGPMVFYGPEELWVTVADGTSASGIYMWVQQVFLD